MYGEERNIQTLVDYGLSNAQAKIYLALLHLGTGSIKEISDASKVARPDTYRAIATLLEIGLAEKIITTPTKYRPAHITNAIETLQTRRRKQELNLSERSIELVRLFDKKVTNEEGGPGHFIVIRGKEAINNKLRGLLDNTQDSAFIVVSWHRLQQWITVYSDISEALNRGIHIRVITDNPNNQNATKQYTAIKNHPNFDIRHIEETPNVWLRIFDGKEIVITNPEIYRITNPFAVLSSNPSVTELGQNYFNSKWLTTVDTKNQPSQSSRQFEGLFPNATVGFSYNRLLFGEDGQPQDFIILDANLAFQNITGIDQTIMGQRATQTLPASIQKYFPVMIKKIFEAVVSGKPFKAEQHFPTTGRTVSVLVYSLEHGHFAILLEDLTELKAAQNALKETQGKYEYLTMQSPIGFYEIDCKTMHFLNVNNYICKASGYSKEEFLSMNPFDLLDDESKMRFQEIIRKSWLGERIPQEVEFGILTKDGSKRWVTVNARLTFTDQELDRAYVILIDITERKRAQLALQKIAENHHALLANISEGFIYGRIILDDKGRPTDFVFLEVNDAFQKSTQLTKETVLGKKASDVFPDFQKIHPELLETLSGVALTGKSEDLQFTFKPLNMHLSVCAYSPEKGTFALIIRDLACEKTAAN